MNIIVKRIFVLTAAVLLTMSSIVYAAAGLTDVRTFSGADHDRVVFDLTEMPVYHVSLSNNGRTLTFDFADLDTSLFRRRIASTGRIRSMSYTRRNGHFYVTINMAEGMTYEVGNLTNPFRIFLDVIPAGQGPSVSPPPSVRKEPPQGGAVKAALPQLKEEEIAPGLMKRTYVYRDAMVL